jgi:hypothetical protein
VIGDTQSATPTWKIWLLSTTALNVEDVEIEEITQDSQGPFSRDSVTSKKAALDNVPRSGTQRRRVFEKIAAMEEGGITRDEISKALNLPDSSTDARVWELKKGGFVMDSDMTRRTRNQGVAALLVPTPKGVTAWRKLYE